MENVDDLLDRVPYRYRYQVRRDVVGLLRERRELYWLSWTISLAAEDENDEKNVGGESPMLLYLHGTYILPEKDKLLLPVDVYIPLRYPKEAPIVRLHCAETLTEGDYRLIYVSKRRKRLSIGWNQKNTLCPALAHFFQFHVSSHTSLSINTLIAQQVHEAVRDHRPEVVRQLMRAETVEEIVTAQRQIEEVHREVHSHSEDDDQHPDTEEREEQLLFVDTIEVDKSCLQVAVESNLIDMAQFLLTLPLHDLLCTHVELPYDVTAAFDQPLWHGQSMLIVNLLLVGVPPVMGESRLVLAAQTAIRHGHLHFLRALLEAGVSVLGDSVCCLLLTAATEGDAYMVQELVEQGVDVHQTALTARSSALHEAARGCYTDVLAVLHAAGADVTALDGYGMTAIHYVVTNTSSDTSAVHFLLAVTTPDGANLRTGDGDNRTPLMRPPHDNSIDVIHASDRTSTVSLHCTTPSVECTTTRCRLYSPPVPRCSIPTGMGITRCYKRRRRVV